MTIKSDPTNPESHVSYEVCDSRHRSNVRMNAATLVIMTAILGGGATMATVFLSRQNDVAEASQEAVIISRNEADKAEREREHIKQDVGELKENVKDVAHRQETTNMSLRLLIQKVENGDVK